jgi:hypothetical protein
MAAPLLHTPPPQVSPTVHAFPSSHGSVLLTNTQPIALSQCSNVQGLLSLQFGGGPGLHEPSTQVSPIVQLLPSLQPVPLGAAGFEHVPFAGSHVPATWH